MACGVAGVAVAIALLLAAPSALASRTQLSIMQDDRLVLASGSAVRERALDQMQHLGVTTLHMLVVWRRLAPAVGSRTRPAFDATDPGLYTGWARYDEAIASAQARGIRVLMTPTGPTPNWASECAPKATNRWRCRPRPSDYGAFVRALGARYSGVFSAGGPPLPRVN